MPVLKRGSSGPDVTKLQQRLKELGFDPGVVDGNLGRGGNSSRAIGCRKAQRLGT